MVKFVDDHRGEHEVEPICNTLPIAPAACYEHLAKRADPARLSERAKRDEALRPEIQHVFDANWQVYGVGKSGDNCAARVSTSPAARWPG